MPKNEAVYKLREVYKKLIDAVYEHYNPDKVEDVPRIMKKYKGQEPEIYDKVVRKYIFSAGNEKCWKPLIETMYVFFNPTKFQDLPKILEKYEDSEAALYRALCDKYIAHGEKTLGKVIEPEDKIVRSLIEVSKLPSDVKPPAEGGGGSGKNGSDSASDEEKPRKKAKNGVSAKRMAAAASDSEAGGDEQAEVGEAEGAQERSRSRSQDEAKTEEDRRSEEKVPAPVAERSRSRSPRRETEQVAGGDDETLAAGKPKAAPKTRRPLPSTLAGLKEFVPKDLIREADAGRKLLDGDRKRSRERRRRRAAEAEAAAPPAEAMAAANGVDGLEQEAAQQEPAAKREKKKKRRRKESQNEAAAEPALDDRATQPGALDEDSQDAEDLPRPDGPAAGAPRGTRPKAMARRKGDDADAAAEAKVPGQEKERRRRKDGERKSKKDKAAPEVPKEAAEAAAADDGKAEDPPALSREEVLRRKLLALKEKNGWFTKQGLAKAPVTPALEEPVKHPPPPVGKNFVSPGGAFCWGKTQGGAPPAQAEEDESYSYSDEDDEPEASAKTVGLRSRNEVQLRAQAMDQLKAKLHEKNAQLRAQKQAHASA
eukprot:TRINITY_DN121159_c0_g1_i1.p1 TRINITY_DN121159_c0_g1~~TRINITY_DN121159_c0_g1_i1.p1  ORF type:complete len:596 (+),score=219.21 TRINITY_DN121159_c0_g1_i1:185-1972(+)